jgi:hypothetical protein
MRITPKTADEAAHIAGTETDAVSSKPISLRPALSGSTRPAKPASPAGHSREIALTART